MFGSTGSESSFWPYRFGCFFFICCNNKYFLKNLAGHSVQEYFFRPRCRLTWSFLLPHWAKVWSQYGQEYGLSPLWFLWWTLKFDMHVNSRLQKCWSSLPNKIKSGYTLSGFRQVFTYLDQTRWRHFWFWLCKCKALDYRKNDENVSTSRYRQSASLTKISLKNTYCTFFIWHGFVTLNMSENPFCCFFIENK